MQARIADQIFFDDIGRDYQMSNVLGDHHKRGGENGENRKPFKARGVECRQREPVGLGDGRGIDEAWPLCCTWYGNRQTMALLGIN